jgi:hypothetical protein
LEYCPCCLYLFFFLFFSPTPFAVQPHYVFGCDPFFRPFSLSFSLFSLFLFLPDFAFCC